MKKIIYVLFGLILLSSLSANAQKIGYCELDKIIEIMPEYERAKAKLEGEIQDIQNQAEEMQVEFNNKYKQYTENKALKDDAPGKWSPAIVQVKEQELSQLQQRMQEFSASAENILAERQYELLEPISAKLDSVIDVIMTEKGFSYIIKDISVIQVNKSKCEDIGPIIKEKLNLQ